MAKKVLAEEAVVSQSGRIKKNYLKKNYIDQRDYYLKNYLSEKSSPLTPFSKIFIASADKYNIDWRLVAAITGVESSFGKRVPYGSYNAYGWANGKYNFKSWEDSIEHVSRALREKYYNKGADDIEKIARRYAPPSSTWAWKVKYFMEKIDSAPIQFELQS